MHSVKIATLVAFGCSSQPLTEAFTTITPTVRRNHAQGSNGMRFRSGPLPMADVMLDSTDMINGDQDSSLGQHEGAEYSFSPRDYPSDGLFSKSPYAKNIIADSFDLPNTPFLSARASTADAMIQSLEAVSAPIMEQAMEPTAQRISAVTLLNAFFIGTVASMALYELLHVDVMALSALWKYGLGQTTGPEKITKISVALELFARLPADAVRSYEALVATNPVFYKACTSGVAYGLGDLVSQVSQGKTLETIDLPRSLRSGAAGFIGHGPLCHYWLTFMETYLDFGGAWWATGIKVTADLTIWATFLNAAYSFLIGMLAFRDPRDVWQDVKATSWPALRSAWRFWPFVHTVSFSHAVPMDLKLLWVDAMEVVWVTILSKVANEGKESEASERAAGSVEVDAVDGSRPEAVDTPLVQKALAAGWPLLVMWPILFGSYQLEKMFGLDV